MQPYLDKPGASSLALEFLSPVKGPSLEQITVEVGSGIRKAKDGAVALRRGREEAGPAARAGGLVMAASISSTQTRAKAARVARPKVYTPYSNWFYLPSAVIYGVLFIVPTFASFYFSLTRWSLFDSKFIGLDNFKLFFPEPQLVKGFTNTLIYAVVTSGPKVVLGLAAGRPAHLADRRPRLPAVGGVLPGAGQHDRRRAHLHGADEPRARV